MISIIHQPNDKLFKLSMTELAVAKEFFAAHLPPTLLKKIDLDTLKLEQETFVDASFKATEADVVYSVEMGDRIAYLYLLCEQQTEVDGFLAFRILGYILRIMEKHRKQYPNDPLPLVYPMVMYVGEEPWDAPLDIFPLFGEAEALAREILFKPYQLLDVQRTSDAVLREQMLSGLVAFVMKYRKTADFAQFLKELMPWLVQVEQYDVSGTSLSRTVLRYVIHHGPQGNEELLIQEAQQLPNTLRGEIMTIAQTIAQKWEAQGLQRGLQRGLEKGLEKGLQQGIEKGLQKGLQKGLEKGLEKGLKKGIGQGIQKGEAIFLQHQLQKRFGNIPSSYTQRILNADAETLLHWGEKILDVETLEEIFSEA